MKNLKKYRTDILTYQSYNIQIARKIIFANRNRHPATENTSLSDS